MNDVQETVRVMIVDSNELLRRGMRDVLARDRRYRFGVAGDVARPEEGPSAYIRFAPDVVFLALASAAPHVGRSGAVWCLHEILRTDPEARVVALLEESDVQGLLIAIQAGARGVLMRDAPASVLIEAAHDVVQGGAALDLRLATVLFDYLAEHSETWAGEPRLDPETLAPLSPREREVLLALAHGYRNKEIAAALGVSVGTVKTHLRHIFRKLKVADRTSAVLLALHARSPRAA